MIIIIDTREQLPLVFTGHETISRKLDEGDYNTPELEDKIVIERKSIPDYYNSITNDHQRFRKEILRATEKGKQFYIFLEGQIADVESYVLLRKYKVETIKKIMKTMAERYNIQIVECNTRNEMSKKIMELMEQWTTKKR